MNNFVVEVTGNESLTTKDEAEITKRNIMSSKTRGEGNVHPKNKLFSLGVPLLLTICLDCGEVISMRVKNPKVFKK